MRRLCGQMSHKGQPEYRFTVKVYKTIAGFDRANRRACKRAGVKYHKANAYWEVGKLDSGEWHHWLIFREDCFDVGLIAHEVSHMVMWLFRHRSKKKRYPGGQMEENMVRNVQGVTNYIYSWWVKEEKMKFPTFSYD